MEGNIPWLVVIVLINTGPCMEPAPLWPWPSLGKQKREGEERKGDPEFRRAQDHSSRFRRGRVTRAFFGFRSSPFSHLWVRATRFGVSSQTLVRSHETEFVAHLREFAEHSWIGDAAASVSRAAVRRLGLEAVKFLHETDVWVMVWM